MDYQLKYLKYKSKYLKMKGGDIDKNSVFKNIGSIGFEFESNLYIPLIQACSELYDYKIFDFPKDKIYLIDTDDVEFILSSDTLVGDSTVDYQKIFPRDNCHNFNNIVNLSNDTRCYIDKNINIEFIITFKNIITSEDIIREKYNVALKMISNFFESIYLSRKVVYVSIADDKIKSVIYEYNDVKSNKKILLLMKNWMHDFGIYSYDFTFKPQCTIKMKYENVPKIINRILYKRLDYSIRKSLNDIALRLTHIIYLYFTQSRRFPISNIQYNYLYSWFVLVLYNLHFYNNYMRRVIGDKILKYKPDPNKKKKIDSVKLFKFYCVLFIRHSMYDLFPLHNTAEPELNYRKELLKIFDLLGSDKPDPILSESYKKRINDIIETHNNIYTPPRYILLKDGLSEDELSRAESSGDSYDRYATLYEYICILLRYENLNNKSTYKFDLDMGTIKHKSTMFDSNNIISCDQDIYIEYRFFSREPNIDSFITIPH